jgi:hypothetical protein
MGAELSGSTQRHKSEESKTQRAAQKEKMVQPSLLPEGRLLVAGRHVIALDAPEFEADRVPIVVGEYTFYVAEMSEQALLLTTGLPKHVKNEALSVLRNKFIGPQPCIQKLTDPDIREQQELKHTITTYTILLPRNETVRINASFVLAYCNTLDGSGDFPLVGHESSVTEFRLTPNELGDVINSVKFPFVFCDMAVHNDSSLLLIDPVNVWVASLQGTLYHVYLADDEFKLVRVLVLGDHVFLLANLTDSKTGTEMLKLSRFVLRGNCDEPDKLGEVTLTYEMSVVLALRGVSIAPDPALTGVWLSTADGGVAFVDLEMRMKPVLKGGPCYSEIGTAGTSENDQVLLLAHQHSLYAYPLSHDARSKKTAKLLLVKEMPAEIRGIFSGNGRCGWWDEEHVALRSEECDENSDSMKFYDRDSDGQLLEKISRCVLVGNSQIFVLMGSRIVCLPRE